MPSIEMVNYEVFLAHLPTSYTRTRLGLLTSSHMTNILKLQIFSSETDEWNYSTIESPSPFSLVACCPGTVLEEMVYWKAGRGHFVAYNCCNGHVQVLEVPHPEYAYDANADDVLLSDILCASNGKLSYACTLKHHLEVWVLHECAGGRAGWTLKFSVSCEMMIKDDSNLKKIYDGCDVKCLHPHNPHLVMVQMGVSMYCYDMISGKLEDLMTSFDLLSYATFPYEWPANLLLDVSN